MEHINIFFGKHCHILYVELLILFSFSCTNSNHTKVAFVFTLAVRVIELSHLHAFCHFSEEMAFSWMKNASDDFKRSNTQHMNCSHVPSRRGVDDIDVVQM